MYYQCSILQCNALSSGTAWSWRSASRDQPLWQRAVPGYQHQELPADAKSFLGQSRKLVVCLIDRGMLLYCHFPLIYLWHYMALVNRGSTTASWGEISTRSCEMPPGCRPIVLINDGGGIIMLKRCQVSHRHLPEVTNSSWCQELTAS